MRVFNVRLAAILLGIAVALGIGVLVLNRYQVHRNAAFFRDESERAEQRAKEAAQHKKAALQEESTKHAIEYLNWYVGLMPKDYKAMEHLGILMADRAQNSNPPDFQRFWIAYGKLEQTVRLDPERIDGRRRLVAMGMLAHRYQDAKDHLERFLLIDSPKDPDLLEQLAECQVGLRMFEQARESLKKAIASKPAQVTAYAKLARLLRDRLSNPKEADQWMATLVKANPKSWKAHYLRAAYLADPQVRQIDEALEAACKAKQLAPDDADVLVLVAECNLAKRKYDNARDCLAHGIKMHPSDYRMYSVMFQVEQSAGNSDKALAVLRQGLKATDQDPNLLWLMANTLVDTNKLDEARRILNELQRKEFPKPLSDFVDARMEFTQQHWKNALNRLSNSRGSMLADPRYGKYVKQIDFYLAGCYRALGDREQQEQALRRVLAVDPSYVPAKKSLAELSRQKGDYADTLKELVDLERQGKLDPAGRVQLAGLLFRSIAQQKEGPRNWKPLEQLLDAVEKALPDSPDVAVLRANIVVLRANLLEAQGKAADAQKLLLQARDKYPKQIAVWNGLVGRAIREKGEKNWEKVEKLLSDAEEAMGDCVELRLLRGQYALNRGGVNVDKQLEELADNAEQFPKEQRVRLWSGLLEGAGVVGDKKLANSLAQKIAELEPNNVEIRKRRFEQVVAAGDAVAAERALKEIEAAVGQDDAYSLWGQAILLCLQAKSSKDAGPLLEKALDYLKKARNARKDWSRVPTLEASIYEAQGQADLALQAFLEAIELGNHSPGAIQETVQLLFRSQRYAEAERLLRRVESEQGALPSRLMQVLADCLRYLKDSERSIEAARKAVPADSKNGRDLVWRGQTLSVFGWEAKKQGRSADATDLLDDAEKALRRAVDLEPKLALAWKALVQFYVLSEEPYKAEKAIQDAKTSVSPDDVPELLAECYEIAGNMDAAQRWYEEMLKKAPQDIAVVRKLIEFYRHAGKPEPAKILLQGILDGKIQASAVDAAWARREMAQFLGGSGRYPDLQKAEKLVEQNLSSPQATFADRQLLARLLANDPDPGQEAREKATEMFESLGAAATTDDRFILARLYARADNWIKAGDLLRSLVASSDKEPRYLEFYIDELLKHNEMSSARTYLDRLQKLAPNSFGTVSRRADLLFAMKQPLQAFETLKDFVDNVDAETRDRGLRIRMVAEKLAELAGRLKKPEQAALAAQGIDSAESLFRTFVKENPGQELVLAVFLGRHGKIDEALRILEESVQTCSVEQFAQACSLILQDGKATQDQMQRMNKIVQSAEARFERAPRLLMALGDLRTHQGLYAEAISVYHEIPEMAPDYASALNNVAVLQALQGLRLDESLTLVNRAMELAGRQGSMLDSRATVYIAMNSPEKAIEDMKDAIADSKTPERFFHQAQAYVLAGDNAKAKASFDEALKKGLRKELLQLPEVPAFEKLQRSLR
jgi:tetratricopeptide (TPR) repeat protein